MARVVTVISKRGCHICEDVAKSVQSLSSRYGFELKVLDINGDNALHDRYFLRVPVILADDREVFDARALGRGKDLAERLDALLRP